MAYDPNIPLPTDLLSVSQNDIKNNFTQANTSFGIDHYPFDDGTANNGKHNQVTTPLIVGSTHPATAVNEPKFYAMQDSASLGVLQYSRGGSNVPPSPLTRLHSPTAPISLANNATTNVIDATGLNLLFGILISRDTTASGTSTGAIVIWNGAAWSAVDLNSSSNIDVVAAGSILQLKNVSGGALSNVFWSLEIFRINK